MFPEIQVKYALLSPKSLSQQAEVYQEQEDTSIATGPQVAKCISAGWQMLRQMISKPSLCCSAPLGRVRLDAILSKAFIPRSHNHLLQLCFTRGCVLKKNHK